MIPERTPSPGNRDTAHFPWGSRSTPARFPTFVPRPNITTSADLKRSSWRFSRNTGSNTTQAKSGDDFQPSLQTPPLSRAKTSCAVPERRLFRQRGEDQDSGNLTLNQCLSWSRRDGRIRPSQPSKARQISQQKEGILDLTGARKEGSNVGRGENRTGWNMHLTRY